MAQISPATRPVSEPTCGDGFSHEFNSPLTQVVPTGGVAHSLLLRGIKSLLRCDDAEVVSGIAHYVISQRGSLRRLSQLIARTEKTPIPAAVALFGGLVCFREVAHITRRDGVAWIARLGQERRAIQPLIKTLSRQVPESVWTEFPFRRRPLLAALSAPIVVFKIGLSKTARLFRLARLLLRRYEFFKVLRVIELVAYYARYLEIFQQGNFAFAVTSNHSNPHGIAFNLAARKCGLPVVLISHGMPVRPVARLSYELAVVHCDAARQTYRAEGCELRSVMVHGRKQDHAPMPAAPLPEQLVVGIFLCKDVNEQRLREVVEQLLADRRVSTILVRPHPTNLWTGLDAWIIARADARLRRSSGTPVAGDLAQSDIVLAGNSSVLVEAVTAGRPSVYVPGLDYGSEDLHEFVASGLTYALGDGPVNFEELLRFYQQPEWPIVLRRFANIDEETTQVTERLGTALLKLAASIF